MIFYFFLKTSSNLFSNTVHNWRSVVAFKVKCTYRIGTQVESTSSLDVKLQKTYMQMARSNDPSCAPGSEVISAAEQTWISAFGASNFSFPDLDLQAIQPG